MLQIVESYLKQFSKPFLPLHNFLKGQTTFSSYKCVPEASDAEDNSGGQGIHQQDWKLVIKKRNKPHVGHKNTKCSNLLNIPIPEGKKTCKTNKIVSSHIQTYGCTHPKIR